MIQRIEIRGLKELRRELKRMDRAWGKALREVHVKVAELVAGRARSASPGSVSGAVKGRGTQRKAIIQVGLRPPRAIAVFMGARRRFGWYSNPRYRGSRGRQFEPWVGNQWDPGDNGGTPYFIGPAINQSVEDVIELYGDEIEKLAARAFPIGS